MPLTDGTTTKETRNEKARTETLLHLLVKGATEYALILLNPRHEIIYWNEGAKRIFGYEEDEIIGKSVITLFVPEDVELKVAEKELENAARNGWADDERWHQRKNGDRFWANGVVTCLHNGNGEVIGYSKVLRDQTQRKITEDRLRSTVAELAQFTYSAAHDLREPLRTASAYVQLLETECKGKVGPAADENFTTVSNQLMRLKVLLENLLAYIQIGDEHQMAEKTDTAAVFDAAVSNLKVLIEENNATVIRSNLPVVSAVPGRLVQVFQNLIANAIKYRREMPPQIRVDARRNHMEWIFSVTDNGEGIPNDRLDAVFEPFKRLHTMDRAGSGLGLSICKRIIERHRGRIWLESIVGKGTKVFFTLPA